jgi:hypothetical protein
MGSAVVVAGHIDLLNFDWMVYDSGADELVLKH